MSGKKLYKSDTNRMICGVCGGVGEYFNIDPTIVRLLFVFFGLTAAAGDHYSVQTLRRRLLRVRALCFGKNAPLHKEKRFGHTPVKP